ncbi:MAG: patatin-like phospholipase family protein [Anaerolineae bacterium]|nr:patatin-like phospholipase family protein [Anaerolineae bacterium]
MGTSRIPAARGKTALVLAGGGLTGAVYEIGALRAIDDLLVDRTVNDFDIYVGTSAGALVATMLASGVSPGLMLEVMTGGHPYLPAIRPNDLFSVRPEELLRSSVKLPRKVLAAWSRYLKRRPDTTLWDLLWLALEALPAGLYESSGLENYVRRVMRIGGYSNHFSDLQRTLYIIATNLDNGERAVFGPGYEENVLLSQAVAASAALPLFYKPVRIGDSEYVDGGLRGNASLDLAIEQGATLVVCINPIVAFDNQSPSAITGLDGVPVHISERGVQAVTSQVLSILLHSGLHYHVKQLRRHHRNVDIILIEPQPYDEHMHFDNIMRYSAQLTIARHGFESVTLDLAEDFAHYREVLARHNIPVSRRLLVEEMQEIWASDYDPEVLRHILSSRPKVERAPGGWASELRDTLSELEAALDRIASAENAPELLKL